MEETVHDALWRGLLEQIEDDFRQEEDAFDFAPYFSIADLEELPIAEATLRETGYLA
ncbi:hypothetical protein SEA_LITTLEFELLA_54 [Gordonia phage LittleFella]|nr:hypothetical protein SEA_LITTLEFELLA_54 [Gordonia phage LittleFella]